MIKIFKAKKETRKRLEKSERSGSTYQYRGCFICKSISRFWFVSSAYISVKISTGLKAKTLKKLCKLIDKDLDLNSITFIKEIGE